MFEYEIYLTPTTDCDSVMDDFKEAITRSFLDSKTKDELIGKIMPVILEYQWAIQFPSILKPKEGKSILSDKDYKIILQGVLNDDLRNLSKNYGKRLPTCEELEEAANIVEKKNLELLAKEAQSEIEQKADELMKLIEDSKNKKKNNQPTGPKPSPPTSPFEPLISFFSKNLAIRRGAILIFSYWLLVICYLIVFKDYDLSYSTDFDEFCKIALIPPAVLVAIFIAFNKFWR